MKLRKNIKALISLCLTLIIVSACFLPAFAGVVYPPEITKDQAFASIGKTDTVIRSLLKETQNSSLKEMVLPELYSDETLSSFLIGIYSSLEEQAGDTLSEIDIDISVSGVASHLQSYGNVSQKLSACSSWADADLTGASWGADSKDEFSEAVSAMMTPFNDLMYALLCSGSFSINAIIGIKGSNGYETAIVPTLKALGCRNITPPATFYENAKADKADMVYSIISDVFTLVEEVLDAPCDRLTDILPSIAYYFTNGGFENAVHTLTEPLKLQIFNIPTSIAVESLMSLITDAENYTEEFSFDLSSMTSGMGITLADLDLELLASCGTASGDTFTSDKADAFVVLLHWVVDTLKLNKDSLSNSTPSADSEMQNMLSGLLTKDTGSIVVFLVSFLNQSSAKINNYQWTFKEYSSGTAAYTPQLDAVKFQRVADNIDDVVNEFLAEMSEEESLGALIKKEVYSSKMLTTIIGGIYGAFESEELSMLTSLLGLDLSPRALAEQLSADGHKKAAESLYKLSSWSSIGESSVNWGVKAGKKNQFSSVLVSALSPLEDVLGMLLAEDKIQVLGAVDIYGSNGYNTAVIPIYEGLGCEASTIKTYEEFKSLYSAGKGIETLLSPVFGLIDRIIERPVYTVLSILPNLLYFADNGLMTCIENLIYPFNEMITFLGLEQTLNTDEYKNVDVNQLIGEFIASADAGITLPTVDIDYIASLGTQTQMISKRTLNGQNVTVPYIQADMPGLSAALLRLVVTIMKTPGNESLMTSFMGGGEEGGNEMFENYSSGIGSEMEAMTEDETVEWLYKLFFRERATVQMQPESEEYMPTIIYEPVKDYTALKAVLLIVAFILVGLIIAALRNREKIQDWIREVKWQRFIKKYERRKEQ